MTPTKLQSCSHHRQVDEEAQEEVLEAEMMENGLVALREAENVDGLQITLPAAASKGMLLFLPSVCASQLWLMHLPCMWILSFAACLLVSGGYHCWWQHSCSPTLVTRPSSSYETTVGAKGKKQRKGKKKRGQNDEEGAVEDAEIAARDERGKTRGGKKKTKKGNAKAGEEEEQPYTDDEIWKQYGSDADLDAPYVPKVYMQRFT